MRNCTVTCECNSHSYTSVFIDQFANTLFLNSAMGDFLGQWSLRWQRKYPLIKTRKKPSENLLFDVWTPLTELHFPFMEQSITTVFGEYEKGYFGSHWGLCWPRKYPQIKTWKELSEKLFVMCEFNSLSYTCISWSCLLALFLWNLRTDFSDRFE